MNRPSHACWTKRPIPIRLPRECGDPEKRILHEVVNNIISIRIDPFGELFIYWIPAFAISLYTSLISFVDLNYIHSSVAMHLSEMDCRVAALLAMTSVGIRHCERSAAIHLTQAKQHSFSRLQGYAKILGFLQYTRLVYNDMAFARKTLEVRLQYILVTVL